MSFFSLLDNVSLEAALRQVTYQVPGLFRTKLSAYEAAVSSSIEPVTFETSQAPTLEIKYVAPVVLDACKPQVVYKLSP